MAAFFCVRELLLGWVEPAFAFCRRERLAEVRLVSMVAVCGLS